MKLEPKQKVNRNTIAVRLKVENINLIKKWAKENNTTDVSILDALIEKANSEDK